MKRKSTIAFFYILAIAAIIGFESYKDLLKPASSEDISELQISPQDKISEAIRIQNKQRFLQKGYADPEHPDILIDAFADIKKAYDGSTYPANYKRAELEKAIQKLDKNAQKVDLNWTERGPGNVSGRSRVILVDPSDVSKKTWWVATVGGGIWKTTNAGSTWELKTPDLLTISTMTLAICESNPDVMYVGTGMGYGRTIDLAGGGVWKSIDHGETWLQLENTANGELLPAINRIIVDPNNENLVLACSNGDYTSHGPNGGTRESGIFRSTDGGQNWTQVFFPEIVFAENDPATDNRVQQLIANPLNFKTIYATVNEVGVIKSMDAGLTWAVVADNFALTGDIGTGEGTYRGISTRTELAITPLDTNRIYAAVERPYGIADLMMSKNGGASWVDVLDTFNDPNWFNSSGISGATGAYTAGWFDNTIMVHPYNKNIVFVGGIRLYRIIINDANNTRETDQIGSQAHVDHHWLEPLKTNTDLGQFLILNANDGGIAVGTYDENGLGAWEQKTGLGSTQFYGVDKKPGEDAYFGGMQDNGSFFSGTNPDEKSYWSRALGGDGVESVWNHGDPNLMMGGSQSGNLSRSTDGGLSWQAMPDAKAGNYAPFISKIAQSKQDSDLLFTVGDAGVKRTDNFGESWTLTPVNGNWLGWKTFTNVEISTASPQVIWISSRLVYDPRFEATGGIHVSRDGGLTFTEISDNFPDNLTEASGIGTHSIDPGTAYMLFSATGTPKIMRTVDYGETWTDISGFTDPAKSNNGFPDVAVYALLVMPYNTNILWAGTEIGLFISTDNGVSWAIADNGFPYMSIFQMAIVDGQIVIATQGRGIWTVDLPELSGYEPQASVLSPRFKNIAFLPTGQVALNLLLPSNVDSTIVKKNDEVWLKIESTPDNFDTTFYFIPTQPGDISFAIESFKNDIKYKSPTQSIQVILYEPVTQFSTDFSDISDRDYFAGNGYSVRTEAGFVSPAIHSSHPYPVSQEMIYTLYLPIEVASESTNFYYEDVVLVEPGTVDHYTSVYFYDYVIVEGTIDGVNWIPLIDGYDSRYNSTWLSAYNDGFDGRDSNTPGIDNMYVSHDIDLSQFFNAGDIIFIRFRLSSDPGWVAWGWAIDNIHIQDGFSSITPGEPLPNTYLLKQNYPNPFNPETNIDFYLPANSDVKITVYNILGQRIRTLINKPMLTGWQSVMWNGKDPSGITQASGVYIYRIEAGSFQSSKRMLLLK